MQFSTHAGGIDPACELDEYRLLCLSRSTLYVRDLAWWRVRIVELSARHHRGHHGF
jgi:hypothetical protein